MPVFTEVCCWSAIREQCKSVSSICKPERQLVPHLHACNLLAQALCLCLESLCSHLSSFCALSLCCRLCLLGAELLALGLQQSRDLWACTLGNSTPKTRLSSGHLVTLFSMHRQLVVADESTVLRKIRHSSTCLLELRLNRLQRRFQRLCAGCILSTAVLRL